MDPAHGDAMNNLLLILKAGNGKSDIRAIIDRHISHHENNTEMMNLCREVLHPGSADPADHRRSDAKRGSGYTQRVTARPDVDAAARIEPRGKPEPQKDTDRPIRNGCSEPQGVPGKTDPTHDTPNWGSVFRDVRVEDILREPSHQEIADHVSKLCRLEGRSFLDAGCGTGGTGMSISEYGARVTLLDYSPDALDLSGRVFHHQKLRADFVRGDLYALPFSNGAFDIVGSFGVLEHFLQDQIIAILREMTRVSRKIVITTVPNARCVFYRLAKWYAEKSHTWQYGYEKPEQSMTQYFEEAGLTLLHEYPLGFIDSLAFLGRIPQTDMLRKIAWAFQQENPGLIDGSLILSIGEKSVARARSCVTDERRKRLERDTTGGKPVISVLMCAWNASRYIAEAIKSILKQTFHRFELIIVDDGSTDDTKTVVAQFDDPRIHYHYKSHSGLADSRNFARSKSRGDYTMIVDADDLIAPELLERSIKIAEARAGTSVVTYSQLELIDLEGKRSGSIWRYPNYGRRDIIPALFQAGKNVIPEASMLIPAEISEKVGPYNVDIRDSDNEFIARLAQHVTTFICVDGPLYFYRQHGNNMSGGRLSERAHSSLVMQKRMIEIFSREELFPDVPWSDLPADTARAIFCYRIAETFWKHCMLYMPSGNHHEFLQETLSSLEQSLQAEPAFTPARTLSEQIQSSVPVPGHASPPRAVHPMRSGHQGGEKTSSLRILYLADCRSPHTRRYAEFFKKRGHDIHIFDVSGHSEHFEGIALHAPGPAPGTGTFQETFLHNVFALHRVIDKIKPDILHGHYLTHWCWWGAFSGFQPFVVTSWGSDVFLDAVNDAFARKLSSYTLQASPLVTADSRDLLEATGTLRRTREGIEYVPFGIDLDLFSPGQPPEDFALAPMPKGARIVLSPRQFKPPANIDTIVKAIPKVLEKVPETVFILKNYLTRNSAFDSYEASIRKMVHDMHLEDHVMFLGDVDYSQIPNLYNAADVMVTLRDTDGSACSMLESMACKTPVVASDIESMREWISDGVNGRLVNQKDPGVVAEAILEILLNPEKAGRYAEASYERVHERADYRKNWLAVESMYFRLRTEPLRLPLTLSRNGGAHASARQALQNGWGHLQAGDPDAARTEFTTIMKTSGLPMILYLSAAIGMAKLDWRNGNAAAAETYYQAGLKMLSAFELDDRLNLEI
jgi:glycosyltransferase involved in cell wall biosynthesis/SAM-dependent methyltransferase/GT2 family glycosyltransferase